MFYAVYFHIFSYIYTPNLMRFPTFVQYILCTTMRITTCEVSDNGDRILKGLSVLWWYFHLRMQCG